MMLAIDVCEDGCHLGRPSRYNVVPDPVNEALSGFYVAAFRWDDIAGLVSNGVGEWESKAGGMTYLIKYVPFSSVKFSLFVK